VAIFSRIPAGWWRIEYRDARRNREPWGVGEPGRRFKDSLPPERPFPVRALLFTVDIFLVASAVCFVVLIGTAILSAPCNVIFPVFYYDGLTYLVPSLLFITTAIDRIIR
jgi:hypothetical protein